MHFAQSSFKSTFLLDYNFYLDNTENTFPYEETRTLFSHSLDPIFRLSFEDGALDIGSSLILTMGEGFKAPKVLPILALKMQHELDYATFYANFGSFKKPYEISEISPQISKISINDAKIHLSPLFFNEENIFYKPLINGASLGFLSDDAHVGLVFDWYGGNLQKRFDEFYVLLHGLYHFGSVAFGAHAKLDHFKNDFVLKRAKSDAYLLDRLFYSAFVYVDLLPFINAPISIKSAFLRLSSLNLNERLRTLGGFNFGKDGSFYGFGAEARSGISFELSQNQSIGFEAKIYTGSSLLQYFKIFGRELYAGDSLYQSPFYGGFSAFYEFKGRSFDAHFELDFYKTKEAFSNAQLLKIRLSL